MTEEVAGVTDLVPPTDDSLWLSDLSNGYRVPTIRRGPLTHLLDEFISMLMKYHGVTEEDIGRVGMLGMDGDYETMVFVGDDPTEVAFARYQTVEEAERGHKEMVERWRRMPPEGA